MIDMFTLLLVHGLLALVLFRLIGDDALDAETHGAPRGGGEPPDADLPAEGPPGA